ncbi:MAG: DUF29 family protein [Gammaproteobacteria bacterium]|jgi:hypothetical protein|nr:DUF29 family protein [Gammaproteobacteria bacterium]
MHAETDLYSADYHAWINAQATLLREGRLKDIDAEQVAEELEAMGRRERNELVNRLIILVAHLLKWQYQSAHRSSGWRGSVVEQRVQIDRELRLSPSLKPFLPEAVTQAYPDAVRIAAQETGLDSATFPALCPYQPGELLDDDFWPG